MSFRFTSLRFPLEKLIEAEYFLSRMTQVGFTEFQYELNAFLSASRSVTFVLQKSFSGVQGFEAWYASQRDKMASDHAMRFFLEIRNVSQKEGPVSYVAGNSSKQRRWSYRFTGNRESVPNELQGREITSCCAEQLAKLGVLLLDCYQTFPFRSCPARALTNEGMAELGYTLIEVGHELDLPSSYFEIDGVSDSMILSQLQKEVAVLNVSELSRIASGKVNSNNENGEQEPSQANAMLDNLASLIEERKNSRLDPREIFLSAHFRDPAEGGS
jgi:hypothetical protein